MKLVSLIQPNTEHQIESLYQTFLCLEQAQKSVLTVLAVVYKPIGITKLGLLLDMLVDVDFLPLSKKDYRAALQHKEPLLQQLLLTSSREGLQINRLLANKLVAEIGQLPTLGEFTEKASAKDKLLEIIMTGEEIVPVANSYDWQNKRADKNRVIRDLYFLYSADKIADGLTFNKNPQIIEHDNNAVLVGLFFIPFDLTHFLTLPNNIQYQAFATLIRQCQTDGQSCEYAIQILEQVCHAHPDPTAPSYNASCHHLLAEQYLYQMRFEDFIKLHNPRDTSSYGLQLWGAYSFLSGENQQALSYFEQAIKAKNKLTKRKKQYLNEVLGCFYKLALMVEANQNDASYFATAIQQVEFEESDRKVNSDFYAVGRVYIRPIKSLSNAEKYSVQIEYSAVDEEIDFFCHQLCYLTYFIGQVWCNQAKDKQLANLAQKYQIHFIQLGYPLFAELCGQIVANFGQTAYIPTANSSDSKLVDICSLVTTKEQWDLALDKLIALNPKAPNNTTNDKPKVVKPVRLIWELEQGYEDCLKAREQKLTKSGWSKGRTISLKRLKEETETFEYLSDSDKLLCRTIRVYQSWGYYGKTEYVLQGLSALNAAVGIDNLYSVDDLSQAIEIVKCEPELLVSEQGNQLCLSIANFDSGLEDSEEQTVYDLRAVSESRLQLTEFSADHVKVAQIIGESGLLIPISAKQKALDGIAAIAPFLNIQSDMSELDTGLDTIECEHNLVINIEPVETGLAFTCVVMPFGDQGPAFKPGIGNASLTSDIKGKRLATQRDLVREEALLDELDKACPAFLAMSDNVLIQDDLQTALATLEQLEVAASLAKFELILRWPKGKKISLSKKLESQHLQLKMGKKSEWFDITGDLQVDNEQVIELRKLLELVKTSNGRFVSLGSEQILALSEDLRHKLEQINQVTDDGKFHPLASLQLEEATTGMRMKTIHAWDEQTKRMHQANAIEPQIPSTFQAQLRDYQLVGFDWASRLAHWGAGACLADDMGLGKTLQALAVLLARASDGPSLVIAPTSVCFNWQQEALKFAPTLNLKLFADSSSSLQRQDLLNELNPFDCVIISYGLLQRESELLKNVHWHTIVADEAQALKNPLAKRTKAAFALKGDFKMITTGTPIENDLTELWSLFRFINPGLLGNVKRFAERFSLPIENAKEDKLAAHKARQGLKTLIQPFILRRMKNQVLTELPPRTEINIQVEMSAKERDFYEALRLNAIDNISQSGQQGHVGEQRIKMLAELVKLRQACCHPKLVMAESELPSAKLTALDELLEELKVNNHKALIFSQFVGHLQIIKQHLENKGFSYQYLDGSTPQKERQKRVNAFQSGEGDIFLISLKAGGSGLNLTAADYVIHMDPWWNPAVEEQASDRAHRIGQKRPVTIYRLITQNTIEEKIVALHQHKRDLADKLLSGNEAATKLSVEDMLNLLKENF
ncbi:DEAD/DEAH box helicase [Paraglaciecola aquimarina]|uniref:DEAD/DEAH box helicase n=1 Tax=Paraglaciecola algarum TaxID=3050085 RepID=A0ABS9D3P7_9ALTE|nr:DEAD/DEAH box helicase [Paraglaciecola sp. G1-23]MCF2947555.1 DEAD/DEAH box helicase [Paraglaciecola sp. G1-23]